MGKKPSKTTKTESQGATGSGMLYDNKTTVSEYVPSEIPSFVIPLILAAIVTIIGVQLVSMIFGFQLDFMLFILGINRMYLTLGIGILIFILLFLKMSNTRRKKK